MSTISNFAARPRALLLALVVCHACTGQERPKTDLAAKAAADSAALELSPEAKVALDSGNVLFRAKQYAAARHQYESAAQRSPAHAAPLFGLYMIGRATGDRALADSAMAGIRARNAVPPHDLADSTSTSPRHPPMRRRAIS
jgi:Tfp pilus assembly protein PilF